MQAFLGQTGHVIDRREGTTFEQPAARAIEARRAATRSAPANSHTGSPRPGSAFVDQYGQVRVTEQARQTIDAFALFLGDADLRDVNFADLDMGLMDVNLAGANLAGVNLSREYLYGAILAEANLSRANLAGATLVGANVAEANLANANLKGATLDRAYLRFAILKGADLEGASLDGANLEEAFLRGARNLDLDVFITGLSAKEKDVFLARQKTFLDSLSPDELARFSLTPERLAEFRREAKAS